MEIYKENMQFKNESILFVFQSNVNIFTVLNVCTNIIFSIWQSILKIQFICFNAKYNKRKLQKYIYTLTSKPSRQIWQISVFIWTTLHFNNIILILLACPYVYNAWFNSNQFNTPLHDISYLSHIYTCFSYYKFSL